MKDKQIDQLRMLPSEVSSDSIIKNNEGIYRNYNMKYSLSLQPAIWKKPTLDNILKKYISIDYRDFELTASNYTSQFNNYFIYTEKDFIKNEHNFELKNIKSAFCNSFTIWNSIYSRYLFTIVILYDL